MNKLFKTGIYSVSFLIMLFSAGCEKDNFPSSPQVPNLSNNNQNNNGNLTVLPDCSIILDSITVKPSYYGYYNGAQNIYPYKEVNWYGKVKNTSNVLISGRWVELSTKVYADSNKKNIIISPSTSFNLYNFKPGESYLFNISTYSDALDTVKHPLFYPDSVYFVIN